jgi:hypothetical protein
MMISEVGLPMVGLPSEVRQGGSANGGSRRCCTKLGHQRGFRRAVRQGRFSKRWSLKMGPASGSALVFPPRGPPIVVPQWGPHVDYIMSYLLACGFEVSPL